MPERIDKISMPRNFQIGEVYLPPELIAAALAFLAAYATAYLLNRFRLARFIGARPLVFCSLVVIYMIAAGQFVIPW